MNGVQYNKIGQMRIQEYNKKSVEFMQQSPFLSKLYEIKPFKIVESPETIKRSIEDSLRPVQPRLETLPSMSSIEYKNLSLEGSSTGSVILLKTISCNAETVKTPQKEQVGLQGRNSDKKVIRKYSNQQPSSPHRITLSKKAQSINPYAVPCPSLMRTPNKQNKLPMGTMIQSHLYTNLSSSIDTLFSKIQKIKQQFECPLSGNKINQSQQQKSKSTKANKEVNDMVRQISAYSPILKPSTSKEMSSLSSLSPLLAQAQNNKQQQGRESYNRNFNLMTSMYGKSGGKEKAHDGHSVTSIENLIMPATHNNISQVSHKTRTIIEQINQLLDSNKKGNPVEPLQRGPKLKKYRKLNTCDNYADPEPIYAGNYENLQYEDFDEMEEQLVPIKLKATQSQYAPKNLQQLSGGNLKGSGKNIPPKYQNQYSGLSYKIDQPFYTEPTPTTYQSDYNPSLHFPQIFPQNLSMRQFQLGKCVGSGKFGDVHICKHKETGLIFALKKIFKSTIKQYNMIEQFTQELRIHYTLSSNHPNITKLYTHFHDQYHIFLLMEYMEDGTLMAHLKRQEEFVSKIIAQVLDAIEYMHRHKIAHRDLKPQNILLSNQIAKLCDFGWSSLFKDQMRSTFCGTLDYVSPQMKDRGEYNTSVDLWSIGVLTFQLLAGFPPHKKEIDRWKVMGGKIKEKWKWDVIFPPQISESAQNFIQSLLKQNPDERISIRQCRQHQFITKYSKKAVNSILKLQLDQLL